MIRESIPVADSPDPSAAEDDRRPPSSSKGRRLGLLTVAMAVLVAAVVGAVSATRSGGETDLAEPEVWYTLDPLRPSDTSFSLALLHIQDPGADLQVLDVRAHHSPNVEYLGAYTVWPSDAATAVQSGGPGYPMPEQKVRHEITEPVPAFEFERAARSDGRPAFLSLTAGFRIVSGDVGAVNGITVEFRAGGKTRTAVFKQAMIACVEPHPCDGPKDAEGHTWDRQTLRRFGLLPD